MQLHRYTGCLRLLFIEVTWLSVPSHLPEDVLNEPTSFPEMTTGSQADFDWGQSGVYSSLKLKSRTVVALIVVQIRDSSLWQELEVMVLLHTTTTPPRTLAFKHSGDCLCHLLTRLC